MAKPKTPKTATGKPLGRPPKAQKAVIPTVTGIRLPDDLRDWLDAMVAQENERLALEGASTNRNALIIRLLREARETREARAKEAPRVSS